VHQSRLQRGFLKQQSIISTHIQMGLLGSSAWTCGGQYSQVERHRSRHLGLGRRKGKDRMNIDGIVELEANIQMGLLGSSAWTSGAE
jgi:hypothetical protein